MAYMKDSTGRRLDSFPAPRVLVPFATKAGPSFDSGVGLSDGVILGGTARLAHVASRSVFGVSLAFSNWYAGASNVETDSPNAITVRASIEAISTATIPVTFNGSKTVVIDPGATVYSDPVGVDIAKGTTFYTRTFVSVTTGQKFPRGGYFVTTATEGQNYANPAGADTTVSGTTLSGVGLNVRVFGPSAILGYTSNPGKQVWGILGDSIASGSGDSDGGYPQRALAGNYAFQKVGFPGEPLVWNASQGKVRQRRVSLLTAAGITHAFFEYGVNSIGDVNLHANSVASWRTLWNGGILVYQPTITPQTNSTDAWATTANQTLIKTTAQEAARVTFNTWLRDGAPIDAADAPQAPGTSGAGIIRAGQAGHPLAGWVDVASLAETALNSGLWKLGYTSDGTHPNATGAQALSAALLSILA